MASKNHKKRIIKKYAITNSSLIFYNLHLLPQTSKIQADISTPTTQVQNITL